MDFDYLNYDLDDDAVRIQLSRPRQLNAMSMEMWTELTTALEAAHTTGDVRAIILSGEGDEFCAGDDINDLQAIESHKEALNYARHVLEHSATIESIGTPVITKIDGKAYGVGCEIAAISDITIATESSVFSLSEPWLGVSALNGLFRLPALIGLKRAREIMLTAREIPAEEAQEIGLVTRVCDSDDLETVVLEKVDQIRKNGPLAVEMTKQFLNRHRHGGMGAARTLAYLSTAEEGREGIEAFLADRQPSWVPH